MNYYTEINVINNKINIMRVRNINYISLTDSARYANHKEPKIPIQTWMRNKDVILNVALFGMTAKEWRESNPKLAKQGNIHDYTDLLHLIILNNLQNTNAGLIEENISQYERLVRLNNSARRQMETLKDNKNIKELKMLQKQVNNDTRIMIDNK